MANSSQSKITNRSVSPTISMDHATTAATCYMVNTSAPSVLMPNMQQLHAPENNLPKILYKVVTPYISSAWNQALFDANITQTYPNLVQDFYFRSPISNPPPIDFTFIPNNLPSMDIQPEYITNLITGEVVSGHMDSPFTIEEAHYIYGGHFRTCPLDLVEKPNIF